MATHSSPDPFGAMQENLAAIRQAALQVPSSDALAATLSKLDQFEIALRELQATLAEAQGTEETDPSEPAQPTASTEQPTEGETGTAATEEDLSHVREADRRWQGSGPRRK